jgi:hypothetical protein
MLKNTIGEYPNQQSIVMTRGGLLSIAENKIGYSTDPRKFDLEEIVQLHNECLPVKYVLYNKLYGTKIVIIYVDMDRIFLRVFGTIPYKV